MRYGSIKKVVKVKWKFNSVFVQENKWYYLLCIHLQHHKLKYKVLEKKTRSNV